MNIERELPTMVMSCGTVCLGPKISLGQSEPVSQKQRQVGRRETNDGEDHSCLQYSCEFLELRFGTVLRELLVVWQ